MNKTIRTRYLIALSIALVYAGLLIFQQQISSFDSVLGFFIAVTEITLDFFIFYEIWRIRRSKENLHPSIQAFYLSFGSLLIGDIIYNIELNVLGITNLRGTLLELTYNIPYMIFLSAAAFAFFQTSKSARMVTRAAAGTAALALSILMLWIFIPKMISEKVEIWSGVVHTICMIAKSGIIGFGIFNLVFSRSQELRVISAGFLTILSYSILLEYIEILGTLQPGLPTEIFWILGQLTIWLGLTLLKKNNHAASLSSNWDFYSLNSRLLLYSAALVFGIVVSWNLLKMAWPNIEMLPPLGIIVSWVLLVLLSLWIYSLHLHSLVISPMEKIVTAIRKGGKRVDEVQKLTRVTEFQRLADEILDIFKQVKEEKEKSEALSKIAAQMSHDIRSPLAALSVLAHHADDLPEEYRQMIVQISSRISLIADTLLKHRTEVKTLDLYRREACLIYGILESVIAEKRLLLSSENNTQIDLIVLGNVHTAWCAVQEEPMGRMVSNLLNNSIEAFRAQPSITNGRIMVVLSLAGQNTLRLSIQDNAGGMTPALEQMILKGFQASTRPDGFGMGLTHAREVLQSCGGRLEVFSHLGFGTVLNLMLPSFPQPTWMAESISLSGKKKAIIIDDDRSIVGVWKARLPSEVDLIHFSSFEQARASRESFSNEAVFFVDYEIRGETENGLDFISTLASDQTSFLVTSHFENSDLQRHAEQMGVRVVPKLLAPVISVEV